MFFLCLYIITPEYLFYNALWTRNNISITLMYCQSVLWIRIQQLCWSGYSLWFRIHTTKNRGEKARIRIQIKVWIRILIQCTVFGSTALFSIFVLAYRVKLSKLFQSPNASPCLQCTSWLCRYAVICTVNKIILNIHVFSNCRFQPQPTAIFSWIILKEQCCEKSIAFYHLRCCFIGFINWSG